MKEFTLRFKGDIEAGFFVGSNRFIREVFDAIDMQRAAQ